MSIVDRVRSRSDPSCCVVDPVLRVGGRVYPRLEVWAPNVDA